MIKLVKGTIENISVDVADRFGTITTLDGHSGKFDVRFRSGTSWLLQNQTITNDDMIAHCLIDTTGVEWVIGIYELFLHFDIGSEHPRIGPMEFELAYDMPEDSIP